MPFIPTPGAFRLTITADALNRPINNVIAVQHAGAGTPGGAQVVAQAVMDAWIANVVPELQNFYHLQSVTAWDQTAVDAPVATVIAPANTLGGRAGQAAPLHSAAVLTLRSLNRGRSARGRIYLGPLPEDDTNGGFMSQAYGDVLAAAVDEFRTDLQTVGITWSVLSLQTGGAPRLAGVMYEITAVELRDLALGTQERRQGRS